jgi:8-oxo-dGTP diphosphatase
VWDFPGGHVEEGEAPHAALVRELREELTIDVSGSAVAAQPQRHVVGVGFRMSLWRIESWAGEPVNAAPDEHDQIQWFDPSDALGLTLAHPAYLDLLVEWAGSPRAP